MIAIIKTGGKQYKVTEGSKIKVEKLEAEVGSKVTFDNVLLTSKEDGSDLKMGAPVIEGAKVEATVSKQDRYAKVRTIKYKNKTHFNKEKNHRQAYTEVIIDSINA